MAHNGVKKQPNDDVTTEGKAEIKRDKGEEERCDEVCKI